LLRFRYAGETGMDIRAGLPWLFTDTWGGV